MERNFNQVGFLTKLKKHFCKARVVAAVSMKNQAIAILMKRKFIQIRLFFIATPFNNNTYLGPPTLGSSPTAESEEEEQGREEAPAPRSRGPPPRQGR